MLTRMILNALQLSNFALNFFLYCTLNAQFRRAFVDWFCRRRRAGRHRRDVLTSLRVDRAAKPRRRSPPSITGATSGGPRSAVTLSTAAAFLLGETTSWSGSTPARRPETTAH